MRCALVLLTAVGCSALPEEYVRRNIPLLWENFKSEHGKMYSAEEEVGRRAIFEQNMIEAAQLEKMNPQAQFGATKFADLSKDEFKVYHNLRVPEKESPPPMFSAEEVRTALATSVDWRSKGAVTQVKDQKQCGSCWSFSSTGGIEGAWFLAGNKLTSVSEQELVSCDKIDSGCNGGLMDNAYQWLVSKKDGEIVTEASYPYTSGSGSSGSCKSLSGKAIGAKISGHKDVTHSEEQMATWMSTNGPLPIAVDAQSHWQTYKSGILTTCTGTQLDHGVLAVGYTSDYWIVKNSWGSSWGESGYIRLKFGDNQCGINKSPTAALASSGPVPPTPPSPPSPPSGTRYHCDKDATPPKCVEQSTGHSTMAKCEAACGSTPPSPPSPSGTFTQKQCDDSKCKTGCQSNSFPIGQCLKVSGGGSAIIKSCTSTGMTQEFYESSTTCTGAHQSSQQPVDQCVQDSAGSYFENLCSSSNATIGTLLRRL